MASKLINKWRNPIRESMLHSLSESSLQVAAREEIIHYFELAQGQLFASDTRLIKMLTVRQEELARTSDESDYGAGKRTCRREERERDSPERDSERQDNARASSPASGIATEEGAKEDKPAAWTLHDTLMMNVLRDG